VPGIIRYKGAKIQLLDLPGIIEGAKDGKVCLLIDLIFSLCHFHLFSPSHLAFHSISVFHEL
jgi:hypothetical protein